MELGQSMGGAQPRRSRSLGKSTRSRVDELLRPILPIRVQACLAALESGLGAMGSQEVQAIPQTQAQGVPLVGERRKTGSKIVFPVEGWRHASCSRMVRAV